MSAVLKIASFRGSLDILNGCRIEGWAFDENEPSRHLDVRLEIDGISLHPYRASTTRNDLREAGIGDGDHAFSIQVPIRFFDGAVHRCELFDNATGAAIIASDVQFPDVKRDSYTGAVDGVVGGVLRGWVWNWSNPGVRCRVSLRAGAVDLGTFNAHHLREDVKENGIGDGQYGFAVRLPANLPPEMQPIAVRVVGTDYELPGSPLYLNTGDGIDEVDPDVHRSIAPGFILGAIRRRLDALNRHPAAAAPVSAADGAALARHCEWLRNELKVVEVLANPHLSAQDLPTFTWPEVAAPSTTLVLMGQTNPSATFQILANLCPSPVGDTTEVVIAVTGSAVLAAHFRRVFPHATVLEATAGSACRDTLARAVQAARGSVVVFADRGVAFDPTAVAELDRTVRDDPTAGLAGAMIVDGAGRVVEAGCILREDGRFERYGAGLSPRASGVSYARETDFCSGTLVAGRAEALRAALEQAAGCATPAYQWLAVCRQLRANGLRVQYQPFAVGRLGSATASGAAAEPAAVENDRKALLRTGAKDLAGLGAIGHAVERAKERTLGPGVLLVSAQRQGWEQGVSQHRLLERAAVYVELGCKVAAVQVPGRFDDDAVTHLRRAGVEVLDLLESNTLERLVIERSDRLDLVHVDAPITFDAQATSLHGLLPEIRFVGSFNYADRVAMEDETPFMRFRIQEIYDHVFIDVRTRTQRLDLSSKVRSQPLPVLRRVPARFEDDLAIALIEPIAPDAIQPQVGRHLAHLVEALGNALPGVAIDSFHLADQSLFAANTPGLRARLPYSHACLKGLPGYRLAVVLNDNPGVVESVAGIVMESMTPVVAPASVLEAMNIPDHPAVIDLRDHATAADTIMHVYGDQQRWTSVRDHLARALPGVDLQEAAGMLAETLGYAPRHVR